MDGAPNDAAPDDAAGTGGGADSPIDAEAALAAAVPESVRHLMARLWTGGHAAFVVGGSVRDALLGRPAKDWDLATDARPDELLDLFPGAVYENAFGMVAVRDGDEVHEITTFRSDHDYADFRRPHRVEFGESIGVDLARRDFTVNAIAWGAPAEGARVRTPGIVDPFGGRGDVAARVLRAVGEPEVRFGEDALRMLRAIRFAATLGFTIEPATMAAIRARAPLVEHLSGERVAAELDRLLAADTPSVGLRLAAESGVLVGISAELAAQQGVPQNKVPGEDLWDHTLRTVDAAPAGRPIVRLAALLHDVAKPATLADGHFHGHDRLGAELTTAFLGRLRYPRAVVERVAHLVRYHMFDYRDSWSDTAVRRFIGRIGREALDELFALREADNVGSGQPPNAHGLDELRARARAELEAGVALDRGDLAIDGDDLQEELDLRPGPEIGRVLGGLLERVLADPALNDRPTLLILARSIAEDEADR